MLLSRQLVRPLHEVGIAAGKMLTVSDQSQNLTVTIAVCGVSLVLVRSRLTAVWSGAA
jgi:hypothetical protein